MAGYSHNGSNNDFALARYTPEGWLDTYYDLADARLSALTVSDSGYGETFDETLALSPQFDPAREFYRG